MHLTRVCVLRSIEIMEPLIIDKDNPVWKCWVAHVALARFCVRDVFDPEIDGPKIDELNACFLQAFEAVPQWQEAGYEKPKMHPGDHLHEACTAPFPCGCLQRIRIRIWWTYL